MAECTDDRLRLLIERVERLEEEKKGIGEDISAVYAEAKAVGYDAKIMRQIVRLRKMKPDDRREMDMLLDTYKAALGIDSHAQTDMFREHDGRPVAAEAAPSPHASADERFAAALGLVVKHQTCSTSWLQRQLAVGYNTAARLVEQLEQHRVVSAPNHVGRREVLVKSSDLAPIVGMVRDLEAKGITMTIEVADKPRLSVVPDAGGASR